MHDSTLSRKYSVTANSANRQGDDLSLDIEGILELLPHRYPFLLVDRLLECDRERETAVAQKMVTINEPYFVGHFPSQRVMPGVLQMEALAQLGALYVLRAFPDVKTKAIYLMSMDHCRFRKPVVPGSVLDLKVTILHSRHKRMIYKFKGAASVNGEVTSEAEFTAMGVPADQ